VRLTGVATAVKALVVFALAIHLHHRFHGPPLDYATLGAAAFASWIGVPGPGEPVLIAAGVLAAKHKLDLGETLLVAYLGAFSGGVGGWLIGLKAGRAVITRRGPFLGVRMKALRRGEEVFERYTAVAVLMTPSWVAGIHRVRAPVFVLWNAVGAAAWALGIGLAAYFAGPPVVDAVSDLGLITVVGVGGLAVAGVGLEYGRRRRVKARSEPN
jgi:membrane protein DedA with SNARE-associated domain